MAKKKVSKDWKVVEKKPVKKKKVKDDADRLLDKIAVDFGTKQSDEAKIQDIAEKVVGGLDKEIEALGKDLAMWVIDTIDKVQEERKTDSIETLDTWQVVLNVVNPEDGKYAVQEVKADKYVATGSYIEFVKEGKVVALFNSCMFLYAVNGKKEVSCCTGEDHECVCDCREEGMSKEDAYENDKCLKDEKEWEEILEYRKYVALQIENGLDKHKDHWINELEQIDKMIRRYKGLDRDTISKKYSTYDCGCGYEYGSKTKK